MWMGLKVSPVILPLLTCDSPPPLRAGEYSISPQFPRTKITDLQVN